MSGVFLTSLLTKLSMLAVLCSISAPGLANDGISRVVFETEAGNLIMEVYESRAPRTAAYFLGFVDRGDYDGATFYRAGSLDGSPEIQLIQGGVMLAGVNNSRTMSVSDFHVPVLADFDTTNETGVVHEYATLSLARDLLQTGDVIPEFLICLRDAPEMDYAARKRPDERGFPAFGKVIQGMDVAQKIASGDRSGATDIGFLEGQILSDPVTITRAYRVSAR